MDTKVQCQWQTTIRWMKRAFKSAGRDFFIRQSIDYHNKWIASSPHSPCAVASSISLKAMIIPTMMMMARDMRVNGNKRALFDIYCSSTDRHVSHASPFIHFFPILPYSHHIMEAVNIRCEEKWIEGDEWKMLESVNFKNFVIRGIVRDVGRINNDKKSFLMDDYLPTITCVKNSST